MSPVRDNIYEWNVKFDAEGFLPESRIRKDLNMLHGRYGYSYIEMIFNFTPDLYPFLPPTVQVSRQQHGLRKADSNGAGCSSEIHRFYDGSHCGC